MIRRKLPLGASAALSMNRNDLWVGLAAALILTTSPAGAAIFEYTGVIALCPVQLDSPCGTVLNVGDSFGGTLNVASAPPNSSFSFEDVTSFSFVIGSIPFDSTDESAVWGVIFTDNAGEAADGFLTLFGEDPSPPPGFPVSSFQTFDLGTGTFSFYSQFDGEPFPILTLSGFGKFTLIPIPGALVLFLPALAVLGVFRRRRT